MAPSRDIILYHYPFSPYARRIVWYLHLRNIPYTECIQPPIMPRPDLAAIGTAYRRIPVLVIGRDIYNDTRLILHKLEALFPASAAHPAISARSPDARAIERLLDTWIVDGGIFTRAAQLIPPAFPLVNDPAFARDRAQFSGRPWSREAMERGRPEALADMRAAFALLEETFFADGREWVLGGEGPVLADILAAWPFHWVQGMKGALPAEVVSAEQFPRVFAWLGRFHAAVTAKGKKAPRVKGAEAANLVGAAEWAEELAGVDAGDMSGLKSGVEVEVWPIDTGSGSRDRGRLVGLTGEEIVIEGRTSEGKEVRIHAPRHGFRVKAAGKSAKL